MYLDPGSGSIIIQVLIAGVLGVGVFVRVFWRKIQLLLVKKEKNELDQERNE